MAELLNSDWFNVDTVLNNGPVVNNQYFDQPNQESVATPPASFASTSLTDRDNVDKTISKNNGESTYTFEDFPAFECLTDNNWLDLLPSSPCVASSDPTSITNINGIHQNFNSVLQSCESNRSLNVGGNNSNNQLVGHEILKPIVNYPVDSTTVDISNSSGALIYSPDRHQSLIFRNSTGVKAGLSSASNSNDSSSSSSPFVESYRLDPLLISTTATRQAFPVSSDCL
uniref:Uncharacterized protein n=1 Tax=Romanomermis culicivorax TaxID=13658 RepID=A0A915J317_ROMCU